MVRYYLRMCHTLAPHAGASLAGLARDVCNRLQLERMMRKKTNRSTDTASPMTGQQAAEQDDGVPAEVLPVHAETETAEQDDGNAAEVLPANAETETATQDFPVVGLGASAGGLAAVEAFFTHMPVDSGVAMAFVLVQHLSPDHKSLLTELVQRFTRMAVTEITDGISLEANHVYIIPPNKALELFHGQLHLMEPVTVHGIHLPIDAFFRSLARDQQERAICIVLSGAGSDGALGVRAVKEVGGLVMAQAPDSAEYSSMPQSAIATDLVDYVLPPEEMPDVLLSYLQQSLTHLRRPEEAMPGHLGELLQKIFILLRAQTRHDFSGYKLNTLRRRIERRMVIHRITSLKDYVHYLQQTPGEVQTLFHELLIGVTRFFRDPEAFEAVQREVIPHLFDTRLTDEAVRIWVPGCSTGEEAYSLAILISEYAQERYAGVRVSVFATDIDAAAIEKARAGTYPGNIAADVTPERLARYFTHDGNSYTVKRAIRDMVVFAEQDMLLDPPFSHLDLISCRNLLIYLGAELQKRVLPIFHYALNTQGFLFLGASETVGESSDLFAPVERKWKIYQRKEVTIPFRQLVGLPTELSAGTAVARPRDARSVTDDGARLRALLEQYLLRHHTPAGVLVNASGDILFVHGSTGRYLEAAPGAANLMNITRMAREGLRLALITILHKAVAQHEAVRETGVRLTGDAHASALLNLLVTPLDAAPELFAVIFEETPGANVKPASERRSAVHRDQRILELEQELQVKEDFVQRHLEELTTANEELQSANGELQSTNEELDTSKEELQSVNEELSTVNTELQCKIDALTHANEDMTNLLTSIEVGTVFVDDQLRIQRFTPAATDIINLIASDIGRPLTHLTVNLANYDRLEEDARQVFDTLAPKEMEVQSQNGRWFFMRILPYRTQVNAIAGVVITFIEITRQKEMEGEMRHMKLGEQAHAYAESIVNTMREPLLVLDAALCVVSTNPAFYEKFQVNAAGTLGRLIYELGNGQWDIPALRQRLAEILQQHTCFNDYVVQHTFEVIGARTMRLNACELRRVDNEPRLILLAIDDITGEE